MGLSGGRAFQTKNKKCSGYEVGVYTFAFEKQKKARGAGAE